MLSVLKSLRFLVRNFYFSLALKRIDLQYIEGYVYRGIRFNELRSLNKIQRNLRNGKGWNFWRYLLYAFFGSKLVHAVFDKDGKIAAFQILYFLENESNNGIIHESFIGVLEPYRGSGLSGKLRHQTILHFKNSIITGISTNIYIDNIASIKTAVFAGAIVKKEEQGRLQLVYPIK
jgi:hypothetical protein